jgi:hypothetical protein
MLKRSGAALAIGVASTSAGGAVEQPAAEPMVVDMTTVEVPIVDGDKVQGSLRVKLAMNAIDPAGMDMVTAGLPRLRATALVTIVEFARLYASPFRAVDNERLSRSLNDALRREEPKIGNVLLLEVAARSS